MANTNPLIGRTFPFSRERIEPLYKNRVQADLRRAQMRANYRRKQQASSSKQQATSA